MRRYLNWIIQVCLLGTALVFITQTLLEHWHEVRALELQSQAWCYGSIALGVALVAQLIEAGVWSWLLEDLQQPVPRRWSLVTFIQYVPAKYVPGNIWHMYGRVMAAQRKGLDLESTTFSVMLEPLFVIAGALGWALLTPSYPIVQVPMLCLILLVIHPRVLNVLWHWFRRLQGKATDGIGLHHYPLRSILGAIAFMGLRGLMFLCAVLTFVPLSGEILAPLISGFSLAWLLRMVIPTPAGLGVFEAAIVAALGGYLSPAVLLGAVTLYRLVVIGAELIGAGCAYLVGPEPTPKTPDYNLMISFLPQQFRRSTLLSEVDAAKR